jgi:hypothetical protein
MALFDHYLKDAENNLWLRAPENGVAVTTLDPGVYTPGILPSGAMFLTPHAIRSDKILTIPGDTASLIMTDVEKFFDPSTRVRFKHHGLIYKRGILLHGAPGTGKSVAIYRVIAEAVARGMIVLLDPSPGMVAAFVKGIRQLEGNDNRQFLVIWEELDSFLIRHEEALLRLLDGEDTLEDMVYLATTNYLFKIPGRIKDRPSRFASVVLCPPPGEEVRRTYFETKAKMLLATDTQIDVDLWVKATEGMVIDNLKDLFISVCVMDIDFLGALNKLRQNACLAQFKSIDEVLAAVKEDKNASQNNDRALPPYGTLCKNLDEALASLAEVREHLGLDDEDEEEATD